MIKLPEKGPLDITEDNTPKDVEKLQGSKKIVIPGRNVAKSSNVTQDSGAPSKIKTIKINKKKFDMFIKNK